MNKEHYYLLCVVSFAPVPPLYSLLPLSSYWQYIPDSFPSGYLSFQWWTNFSQTQFWDWLLSVQKHPWLLGTYQVMYRFFTWEFQSVHHLDNFILTWIISLHQTILCYFLFSQITQNLCISDYWNAPTFPFIATCKNLIFFKSDLITLIKPSLIWYMSENYNSSEILEHYGFTSFGGFNPFCIILLWSRYILAHL